MSARNVQGLTVHSRNLRKGYEDYVYSIDSTNTWVRNQAWPVLTQPDPTSQTVTGLYAVLPGDGTTGLGNFFSVLVSGDYTIDQGDGTVANVSAGVQRDYEYNFNSANLYDATVTFNSAGSTVQRASHGYVNGDRVRFYRLVTATYITEDQFYYVVNSTSSSFQISLEEGGSVITFSTNGSASLLPYKIATVTITPQSGQNLTSVDFTTTHPSNTLAANRTTSWLDLAISGPSINTLSLGAIRHTYIERVNLLSMGSITSFTYLLANCPALRSVSIEANTQNVTDVSYMFFVSGINYAPFFDTSSVTNFQSMFSGCAPLKYVPAYNTSSGVIFSNMFANCYSLVTVPEFNTQNATTMEGMFNCSSSVLSALSYVPQFKTGKVTTMKNMFAACSSLTTCPFFDTGLVTDMSGMFNGCTALRSVPFFNTTEVTTMASMFLGCRSLSYIPCFNTSKVTDMSSMFQNCNSLLELPELDTSLVTTMASTFSGCSSIRSIPALNTPLVTTMASTFSGCGKLESVPLLNTVSVTNMSSMFNACYSLKSIPAFNTALVTTMASMFSGCTQIESVPLFNTALVTSMASMFQNCYRLQSVPLFNTAAVTAMNNMFTFCQSLRGVPLFNTSLVTTMASMFSACSFLRTVPLLDTSSVTTVNSMFSGCTSLSSIPALVVTSVSSSANFTNFVLTCNSNGRVQAKNFRFSFSLVGNRLSKTALEEVFSNLPTVTTSQTLTIASNYGVGTLTTKTANLTLRSSTISLSDTSGLSTGMILHSGTGTGITTGISATSSTTADTLTYTSHGLSNGTVVSFSSIGTTTGISTWTPYYVVNSTADTFQISLTLNGAAIDLTGSNGTVVVRYANYITNINPNVSITLSTPCASTASNSSLSFRTLDTANALLKNWALVL